MKQLTLSLGAVLCLAAASCGGHVAPHPASAAASAPPWARAGDQKTSAGKLFVCEGEGANEDDAKRAALAVCSAKICELCGVEVESTVETRETLTKVDIERKVVETCRRVRKSDDEVRYKQSSCGPDGCTSFVQVFFSAEAEARECKAYADGNYADSAECERLIEEFRNTRGLDAASFHARAELLTQAVVACAEIDVRPTPKLTALDEILWQGVISPSLPAWSPAPDDPKAPLAERVRVYLEGRAKLRAREHQEGFYRPIDRQPLRETKVFVDKLTMVRDAMRAYESIMTLTEALVRARYSPEPSPDKGALISAMRGVIPFAKLDKKDLHFFVARILAEAPRDWRLVKDFLVRAYPPPWSYEDAFTFSRLFAADGKVSGDEWGLVMQGEPCVRCFEELAAVRDHGGESERIAHIAAAVAKVHAQVNLRKLSPRVLDDVEPELLLRVEPKLAREVAASVFTWARLERALAKLSLEGGGSARKELLARLIKQLEIDIAEERCERLDSKLSTLERGGVDTRRFEAALCRCLEGSKSSRRVGELDELYLRLIDWGARCVQKGGES